ncbi:YjbF family lipoprotein [Aliiroseovarius marinus]|uniref:YjbF family lipoprotein n=1 Tax=Aliiroseovarius marinus TaxID=2500159 RepID=UPI003D7CD936
MTRFAPLVLLLLAACLRPAAGPSLDAARAQIASLPAHVVSRGVILVQAGSPPRVASLTPSGKNGPVTTWQSGDRVSLSFLQGVLVATRGLGDDLMAQDAGPLPKLLSQGQGGTYQRQTRHLSGENQIRGTTLTCSLEPGNPERILLANGTTDARRFVENCHAGTLRITNLYWRDTRGSLVKSYQWISEGAGYATIEMISAPPGQKSP